MRLTRKLFSAVLKQRPFYVTTPIFYVNAAPHLGHIYTAIVTDAAQRFERLIDPNCRIIFSTGTDEHGTKVQQAADRAKLPLPKYCENVSQQYKTLFDEFDVDYTDYVRTTEERHKKTVHHFWNELKRKDYIYKAKYSGWYSVNDEAFVPSSHIRDEERDGVTVKVSTESGHVLEWSEETNYMFRLSAFKTNLQEWLRKDNVVSPTKFQRMLEHSLADDNYLPDLSVSRPSSRVHWALRVPDDEEQSIYVWLDALVNYLTVIGYPDVEKMNSLGRPWPADLQVVGKDILRFHAIYWPAFLMAAGLNPPRRILCHGHWTVDGQKMSKSLGNVVDPRSTPGGLEALRYFLLREGTMHSDANFSETKLVRTVNAELADTLGNLLSRCTGTALNPRNEFPPLCATELRILSNDEPGERLLKMVENLPDICLQHYNHYNFYKVVDSVMSVLHAANLFFESTKPWELKKKPEMQKKLDVVLHVTLETLRVCAIILQPIVPRMTNVLLNKLDISSEARKWENLRDITWCSGIIYESKKLKSDKVLLFQRIYSDGQSSSLKPNKESIEKNQKKQKKAISR